MYISRVFTVAESRVKIWTVKISKPTYRGAMSTIHSKTVILLLLVHCFCCPHCVSLGFCVVLVLVHGAVGCSAVFDCGISCSYKCLPFWLYGYLPPF